MNRKGQEFPVGIITFVVIAFIVLFIIFLAVYTVPAGYRGVILTFGKPSEVISGEGLHFKVPFAQSIKKLEVRTQKIESESDSSSKDLQDVKTVIALNYHLNPGKVNKLYQEIGKDYKIRVIDPSIQESVKAVSARFTAEELVTRRPEVRKGIQEFLTQKLEKYHILVDDFNIVNFQFSEEFDNAIEQKVTAEQLKLKADRDLQRIAVEAEQVKTQSEAEAYSLKIKNDALRDSPDLVRLKQIEVLEKSVEVQRQAVEKWDGKLPAVTGSGALPLIELGNLNINDGKAETTTD